MADLGALVGWKLASAAIKVALKAFLPEHESARELVIASVEALLDHLKTPEEKGFVGQIRKRVTDDLPTAFGILEPKQAREDPELQEALATILDAVDRAGEAAANARLDPERVPEALVEIAHSNPRWKWLSPAQRRGCETVLRGIGQELAPQASQFGGFDETAVRETLNALDQLMRGHEERRSRLSRILDSLPPSRQSEIELEDRKFELRYRQAVSRELNRMRLWGLAMDDRADWHYSLSAAYVQLRVTADGAATGPGGGQPEDEVLSAHQRLMVIGNAGFGKSTLLQRLAVRAALGDFGPADDDTGRRSLVPFFISLRDYVTRMRNALKAGEPVVGPSPDDWVKATLPNLAGPPGGWVSRQIEAERALLLVDGVDEVPDELQPFVRDWIEAQFRNGVRRVVVSSRPYIGAGWLTGFTDCRIMPLDLGGALALVNRWHLAVAGEETDAALQADAPRRAADLQAALKASRPLRELADSPLLCAMICALHYRQLSVPPNRYSLYETCCENLIDKRELVRRVAPPERLRWLDRPKKLALLEGLALRMVRNEELELEISDVDATFGRLLRSIQHPKGIKAAEVRKHVVERSALLTEPVPGHSLRFVHKTFMEFLAARAAVAEGAEKELVRNADRTAWTEVIRLAPGALPNARRTGILLNGLLAGGDPCRRLLAVACLEACVHITQPMRNRLTEVLKGLAPPRSEEAAQVLAVAGPVALSFLGLRSEWNDDTRAWCVTALCRISGNEAREDALALLEGYATAPGEAARGALVRGWSSFEPVAYARQVLAPALGGSTTFRPQGAVVLAGLEALTWIEELDLSGCPAVADLSPIFLLPKLRAFTNKDGAAMVWVSPGEFTMGSADDDPEAGDDERPAHRVRITRGFWLSRTPVTNAQYRRFVQATGSSDPRNWDDGRFGGDDQPVVEVSCVDAAAYCAWAGGRLPTEAEWEYAARGPEGRRYPWGDAAPTSELADFGHRGRKEGPLPVGSKPAGASWCGALDLAGSVWEWCSDRYGVNDEPFGDAVDPAGPETGDTHIARGGAWSENDSQMRAAVRVPVSPLLQASILGFRCVVDSADPISEI